MKNVFFSLLTFASAALSADLCDPCNPCDPCPEFTPPPSPTVCAYNAPYGVDLLCQWDIFLKGSFIWLEAKEENLSLGTIYTTQTTGGSPPDGSPPPLGVSRAISEFGFEYKPGFKVGLGINFDCDNWELYAEYTYLHPSVSTSISPFTAYVDANDVLTVSQIIPAGFGYSQNDNFYNGATGNWDLKLDLADLELARQYYVGRCLTFRSFGALRAAWIRQDYTAEYQGYNQTNDLAQSVTYKQTANTKSWAIGPRVGVDAKWLFCGGFRFFGNTSGSLLFTKYTKVSENSARLVTTIATGAQVIIPQDTARFTSDPCYVRPQAEMTIGAGWGDYFFCNKWYFDLEVGYTFNVFWNQNMFLETLVTNTSAQLPTKVKGGDLSLHGLVVTARLDF